MKRGLKAGGDQEELDYRPTLIESRSVLSSLLGQVRERLREHARPRTLAARAHLPQSRLPVTEMPAWYVDLPQQIRFLFSRPLVGALAATSLPATLGEAWRDYPRDPASWVNSLMVHALVLTALMLPFIGTPRPGSGSHARDLTGQGPLFIPVEILTSLRGGGGGGTRSPLPASRGPVPHFSETPLAPPSATIPNLTPVLPVQPNLLGPRDLILPEMALKGIWGDPRGVAGPGSNGSGTGGGTGGKDGTGVGPDSGPGYNSGPGGPGIYSPGNGVSAPVPLYKPEPPYSEEARKSKYQGTVNLWIVVDSQGRVSDVRIVKPLGMGLDEKAVETVRTWKFKPAMRSGAPVAVRVMVEIAFRLF